MSSIMACRDPFGHLRMRPPPSHFTQVTEPWPKHRSQLCGKKQGGKAAAMSIAL